MVRRLIVIIIIIIIIIITFIKILVFTQASVWEYFQCQVIKEYFFAAS